ncbi:MAG: K(+)-transporting ATPase subunit C [Sediminibacterium sp.]
MQQHILPAIRLTLFSLFFFCGVYTVVILGIAQLAPDKGLGETVTVNGKSVGYRLEGQSFTADKYFNGRPSATDYNAAGSSGSNRGPSNPVYLKQVRDRIDSFLVHNPAIKKEEIPADLVTASGSGLDPDISPEAAYIQVSRIAKLRNTREEKLKALIDAAIKKPILGIQRVNVLQLNIALDQLK